MTRQDTIKELRKAGKTADVKDILKRHGDTAQRAYAEIRADERTSDTFKRQSLAVAHVRAQREVDAELQRAVSQVVHLDRDDASVVFGTKGIDGDAASLIIARRDAGDRVSQVTDQQELGTLLRRATRRGDEIMARAIAERATEIDSADVMNQFLADRPNLDAAGTRLWNAERATTGWDMNITGAISELGAPEFAGMTVDRVADVAEGNEAKPAEARAMFDGLSAQAGGRPMASAQGLVSTAGGDALS